MIIGSAVQPIRCIGFSPRREDSCFVVVAPLGFGGGVVNRTTTALDSLSLKHHRLPQRVAAQSEQEEHGGGNFLYEPNTCSTVAR